MGFGEILREAPPPPTDGTASSDVWLPLGAPTAALAEQGDPVPTGWHPIDSRLRGGGVPPGKFIVLGGASASGKTTVACQIALQMATRMPVFALFDDEGREQADARMGVILGVPLSRIDREPKRAGAEITELGGERSLLSLKPQWSGASISALVEKAIETVAPGEPALLIIDSIQTVALTPDDDPPNSSDEERRTIQRNCDQIRDWGAKHRFIFLALSQSPRSSYRSRSETDNANPLTGFAGGRVENFADFAMMFSAANPETGIIRGYVVKNRLGGPDVDLSTNFQIRYSHTTGRMEELDLPTMEEESAQRTERQRAVRTESGVKKHERAVASKATEIERLLIKHPEMWFSIAKIQEHTGGKKPTIREAATGLQQTGVLDYKMDEKSGTDYFKFAERKKEEEKKDVGE